MRIVVDESVPTAVAEMLAERGHEATHVAREAKGAADVRVWQMAVEGPALLITRDHHFTDAARYDPSECLGVVFLRKGNMPVAREVALVAAFFDRHDPEEHRGQLVTLWPGGMRIR